MKIAKIVRLSTVMLKIKWFAFFFSFSFNTSNNKHRLVPTKSVTNGWMSVMIAVSLDFSKTLDTFSFVKYYLNVFSFIMNITKWSTSELNVQQISNANISLFLLLCCYEEFLFHFDAFTCFDGANTVHRFSCRS